MEKQLKKALLFAVSAQLPWSTCALHECGSNFCPCQQCSDVLQGERLCLNHIANCSIITDLNGLVQASTIGINFMIEYKELGNVMSYAVQDCICWVCKKDF